MHNARQAASRRAKDEDMPGFSRKSPVERGAASVMHSQLTAYTGEAGCIACGRWLHCRSSVAYWKLDLAQQPVGIAFSAAQCKADVYTVNGTARTKNGAQARAPTGAEGLKHPVASCVDRSQEQCFRCTGHRVFLAHVVAQTCGGGEKGQV